MNVWEQQRIEAMEKLGIELDETYTLTIKGHLGKSDRHMKNMRYIRADAYGITFWRINGIKTTEFIFDGPEILAAEKTS